ncbi:hypothetical protein MSG28_010737 [Choristoneura fumiferana]|uniref:Uncharacterized protein n=1 Tax=Choristoneura fumiferana TaxID=7141 RepID=A0ACC0KNR8_CHOFU|nr:hypothetical protein MSG28_010737 [Choristoneura fumiferana]
MYVQTNSEGSPEVASPELTTAQKRRIRRKKLHAARTATSSINQQTINFIDSIRRDISFLQATNSSLVLEIDPLPIKTKCKGENINKPANPKAVTDLGTRTMSSTEKSREEVKAAREAKKLAKQKGKKVNENVKVQETIEVKVTDKTQVGVKKVSPVKGKDEVDKAVPLETKETIGKDKIAGGKPEELGKDVKVDVIEPVEKPVNEVKATTDVEIKSKEQILAERAAKKAAKQNKKKSSEGDAPKVDENMTVKDVVNTLKDIVNVAKEVQDVTAKVQAIHLEVNKPEESSKSKAELKAERRAKQEAQRAAKQAAQKPAEKPKEPPPKAATPAAKDKEKSPKPKTLDRAKSKPQVQRVNWFQHLYEESDKEALQKIAINSNLHPAILKLGVQLSSRVVTGSNARCIALLDALKKMVSDYILPARTEYARGLEAHLAASLEYLWAMRQPTASQTNAVKFFRHHLTQLPHNVDEFDAKKTLHEEIDRYIREQIDMAGEAISIAVRNKINDGDKILTYGCSSLIERILRDAWDAGVKFETFVVGNRVHAHGREMLRRLEARGLPCTYLDITGVSYIMQTISKVIVGAQALLADGSVRGALGTAQTALLARARNVPVLVACETHKVSARVQAAAADHNELGDPDDLIDKSDPNSPLKDWRSNCNLTPLNLMYDVTPPSLVTAVVTELAILPCTSAPVVLRFKLSEYGI